MLAWTIYLSFAATGLFALAPIKRPATLRVLALLFALAGLGVAVAGSLQLGPGDTVREIIRVPWIRAFGIEYHLAADGISMVLLVLTGIAAVTGILFSWNVEHRLREFLAFFFALIGGVYGVFLSFDLFLLFVFYEIAIVPKYFLIAIWGSTNREYGAMKLALYSFVGSALVLVGLLAAWIVSGATTFNLLTLAHHPFSGHFQSYAFPVVFIGFAILAGLWPFHTWAPTGHVAAPTAASMLLAGVVMKLGAYGALRVALTLFPVGALNWQPIIGGLATIGIVYGALVALTQKDFKFVIGYSSVSHMGFVLLGLMSANLIGLTGAVLQMFSHGILAGLLFGVVGRMVYERTHTRSLDDLAGMDLAAKLPFAAGVFVLAGFASMGLPGFSGFVAELQVLIGAWHGYPTYAILAGVGIVVGAAYTLRAMQKAFFGRQLPAEGGGDGGVGGHHEAHGFDPITPAEKVGAVFLLILTVALGLYPRLLLDWIVPSFQSPLFEAYRKGVGL